MTSQLLEAPAAPGSHPSPRQRAVGSKKKFDAASLIAMIILIVAAIGWLLPFAWAIVTSLKSETDAGTTPVSWFAPNGYTFAAYAKLFSEGNLLTWTANSLFTTAIITIVTVVTSALAGYAFSRIDFGGRRGVFALVIASIVIPPQVLIIPLFYEMLAFGMVDTYWGIILPQVIAPPMVFILKKFFDQIPIELEEAARVDGASRLRIFVSIVVPLSRPILAAVSIFVFIAAWNNFLWPFIVTNDSLLMTLPVGLQTVKSAFGVQYAENMAMAILAALPLIIVFLIFQRQIIKGIATTGLGGQ